MVEPSARVWGKSNRPKTQAHFMNGDWKRVNARLRNLCVRVAPDFPYPQKPRFVRVFADSPS